MVAPSSKTRPSGTRECDPEKPIQGLGTRSADGLRKQRRKHGANGLSGSRPFDRAAVRTPLPAGRVRPWALCARPAASRKSGHRPRSAPRGSSLSTGRWCPGQGLRDEVTERALPLRAGGPWWRVHWSPNSVTGKRNQKQGSRLGRTQRPRLGPPGGRCHQTY